LFPGSPQAQGAPTGNEREEKAVAGSKLPSRPPPARDRPVARVAAPAAVPVFTVTLSAAR
jgi:hypothetical protein